METATKLNTNEIKKLSNTFDSYITSRTSSALSSLFNEPIEHKIQILDEGLSKIKEVNIPDDEITMCGVRLNGKGDTHIEICYTIKQKHAKKIAAKLLGQEVTEIDELGTSAIQEVANIMTGSFFNAMASGTGFRVDLSTPDFSNGELAPLITICAKDVSQKADCAVIADAELVAQKSGIKIHMIILQNPQDARKLLANQSPSGLTERFDYESAENVSEFDSINDKQSEYAIGGENSELDALVDGALEENETK